MRVQIAVVLASVTCHTPATAGAWNLPPGRSLAILKSESDTEWGAGPTPIAQQSLSLLVERGVTRDLSVELQTGVQWNGIAGARRTGPSEQAAGLKYRLAQWRGFVISSYVGERGLFDLGIGPFAKDTPDWRTEARGLIGANYRILGRSGYVDIATTALYGGGSRLQFREDANVGLQINRRTTFKLSLRSGQDQRATYGSGWTTQEATTVRKYGHWRLEAGWRRTVTTPTTTMTSGPVFAIWRSF